MGELSEVDLKFVTDTARSITEQVDVALMHTINVVDELSYTGVDKTDTSLQEYRLLLTYCVVALDYMMMDGFRLPANMPKRSVRSTPEAVEYLKRNIEYGWTPPPYDLCAQMLIRYGFTHIPDRTYPRGTRDLWELIISDAFEYYQINNGMVESI